MIGAQAWERIDDQLTRTFIFTVALNSVNSLEPKERGIVFLATMALLTLILAQLEMLLDKFVEEAEQKAKASKIANDTPIPKNAGFYYWEILQQLFSHLSDIVLSVFSTAAGAYVSTVMGKTITERPVYSLAITSLIVAVLYLVKSRLQGRTKKDGHG